MIIYLFYPSYLSKVDSYTPDLIAHYSVCTSDFAFQMLFSLCVYGYGGDLDESSFFQGRDIEPDLYDI